MVPSHTGSGLGHMTCFGKGATASELKGGDLRLRDPGGFWSKWAGAGGVGEVAGKEGNRKIPKETDWDLVAPALGE